MINNESNDCYNKSNDDILKEVSEGCNNYVNDCNDINNNNILKEVSDKSNDVLSESSSSEKDETIKRYSNIFITKNSFKYFNYNTNIIDSTDHFIK